MDILGLKSAATAAIAQLADSAGGLEKTSVADVQAVISAEIDKAGALLESLDGWTLEITILGWHVGTIRLTKPAR